MLHAQIIHARAYTHEAQIGARTCPPSCKLLAVLRLPHLQVQARTVPLRCGILQHFWMHACAHGQEQAAVGIHRRQTHGSLASAQSCWCRSRPR